jgi:hypothetical protein
MHVKEFLIKKVSRRHCGALRQDFFFARSLCLSTKNPRQVMARVTAVRAGMTRKVFISFASSSPSSALNFAFINGFVSILSNFFLPAFVASSSDANNQSEKCL